MNRRRRYYKQRSAIRMAKVMGIRRAIGMAMLVGMVAQRHAHVQAIRAANMASTADKALALANAMDEFSQATSAAIERLQRFPTTGKWSPPAPTAATP